MDRQSHFAAIVVHYGDESASAALIRSLEEDPSIAQVFVIDNGSADRRETQALAASERVCVIRPGANLGYGGGANIGIEDAITHGFDDVVVLAMDAVIAEGALAGLVEAGRRAGAAIAGPRIVYQGSRTVWADGIDFAPRWGISRGRHKGRALDDTEPPTAPGHLTGHVIALLGCSERPWLRFDERFFMYYEDLDLCERARRRGALVILDPATVVEHVKPGGFGYRFGRTQQFHMSRSAVVYARLHGAGRSPRGCAGLLALTVYRATKSAGLGAAWDSFRGLYAGLRAYRLSS